MNRFLPDDGDLFTAKPMQLDGLLRGIKDHGVALPDFQRPWVWEPEMVRDLLISVAYRYPAGSLLTMPVSTEGFALRPFEGSGETLNATPHTMVLDGQQRLTSLFQSLLSPAGVGHKGRIVSSQRSGVGSSGQVCQDEARSSSEACWRMISAREGMALVSETRSRM